MKRLPVLLYMLFVCLTCLVSCRSEPPMVVKDAHSPVTPASFRTVCAGSDHPAYRVIFLQGIQSDQKTSDGKSSEQADTDYPALLDAVGKALNVQFAIPYSDVLCRNSENRYCWGTAEPVSVAAVYATIRHSAAQCFSLEQPWGLLGFSNGGYHIGRIIAQGHLPQPAWAMAIGSAGSETIINAGSPAKQTPFYLGIGTEDITRNDAHHFFVALEQQGFNVRYEAFAGGHELTEAKLIPLLKNVLQ